MRSLKESLLDLTENVIRLRRQLREIEIQAETQMQSRTAQADELHAGFDPLEFQLDGCRQSRHPAMGQNTVY